MTHSIVTFVDKWIKERERGGVKPSLFKKNVTVGWTGH